MENIVEALTVPACSVLAWGTWWVFAWKGQSGWDSQEHTWHELLGPSKAPRVSLPTAATRSQLQSPEGRLNPFEQVDMFGQRRVLKITFTEPSLCVRHFHISIALTLTTLWSRHSCYPHFEVRLEIYIWIWITDIFYFTDQVELPIFYLYWPIKFHVNQPKTQSVIWRTSSCYLQLYGGWDGTFIIVKWTSVSWLMLFALNSSSCDMKGLVLDFFSLTFASCISAHPSYFQPFESLF